MNTFKYINMQTFKRALVSVYDKTNLIPFAKFLLDKNVQIVSTGGTYRTIINEFGKNSRIIEVADLTGFPEILNGRVKTLHPIIHGGILAKKDNLEHMNDLEANNIQPIDIVVTNLYPFKQVLQSNPNDEDLLLENIDIGGHTLIRAAAKNYKDVLIVNNVNDYNVIMDNSIYSSNWSKTTSVKGNTCRHFTEERIRNNKNERSNLTIGLTNG